MASARTILWTLLLSLSLSLLHADVTSPAYDASTFPPESSLGPTYAAEVTGSSEPPTSAATVKHFTNGAVLMPTIEDITTEAPTSGRMIMQPFALASTDGSLTQSAVATDATASVNPTAPVIPTASVSPTPPGIMFATTVGTEFPTGTTVGPLDPLTNASTISTRPQPFLGTTLFAFNMPTTTTEDDLTVPPSTEGSTMPSDLLNTNHTKDPAPKILLDSLTPTLVTSVSPHGISVPEFAAATTPAAHTDGSTLIENTHQSNTHWIIIVVVLTAVVCACGILCICLIKRRARAKHFGSGIQGSQRSKKKKGLQDDTWAGPVKLSGAGEREDCEGGEDRESSGEGEKEADLAMSTFIANETEGKREGSEGGVGRPGSPETMKWEEEGLPLLYIDEDVAETPEPVNGLHPDGAENDLHITQDVTPFCLTTAV